VSRTLAKRAGVPIPPGSDGLVENEQEAKEIAKRIGYPVMIKAIAGGGGRGMRIAHNDMSLVKGFYTARTEAEKAFGNSGVYIEKFIENPHHIEFQILGDNRGNIIHLGERDCSVQRRNQKIVEETPSPLIENKHKDLRKKMGKAAVRIAEVAQYTGAGTVEFIVDDSGAFFFLEVNKRIQVEHPITEEVTGVDLVKQQLLVALGEPMKLSQNDVRYNGHAIECRINAEDPFDDFRPCPGRIEAYYPPGGRGVRLDSHIYAGYTVPSVYDSLIAKLVTHGKDRREAMDRMGRALGEFMITGPKTTIAFQQAILQDPNFRRGVYSTAFVEQLLSGARR
jgi:acetyl-CoA carboxylase biotin carboxylase subunit